MIYPVFALLSEIGYFISTIISKQLRNRDIDSLSILGIHALSLPIWIAVFIYLLQTEKNIIFSTEYLLITTAWTALCFAINLGGIFIIKFQSLSENSGLTLGISTIFAVLYDHFLFNDTTSLLKTIPIIGCIIGGIQLSNIREKHNINTTSTISFIKKIPLIIALSLMSITMLSLYKKGLHIQQDHLFIHISLSHILLFVSIGLFGYTKTFTKIKCGALPIKTTAFLVTVSIVTAIFASLAINALPITLIILFTLLRSISYAVHDFYTKEIPLNITSLATIFIVLLCMIIIAAM